MKRRIKLTERDLHKIIRNQVKRVLNEGSTSQEVYNKWEDIKEVIGSERMIDDIWNYLDTNQLEKLVDWFDQDYDLFDNDDDFEDEEY